MNHRDTKTQRDLSLYPKYESYKDSGVEWLGSIPETWQLKKFKYLTNIQKGKMPKNISSNNTNNYPPYLSMEYLRGADANQFVLDKGAQVIVDDEVLLLWDGSNAGEFIKSRAGVISSTVAHIDFTALNKSFAWYACHVTERFLRSSTVGMGIPHVDGDELKSSSLALPPENEQKIIANFLDKKTAKIDQAVAIKEKQIALLKERKQILIQNTVTQGLNPNAPMKDSGIDWIGQIPQHWTSKKIKYLVKFYGGSTPSKERSDFWGGEISWVSPKDMKMLSISSSIDSITSLAIKSSSVKLLPEKSVLIVVRGMILAKKIPVAITEKELTINQDMKAMVVGKEVQSLFFMTLLDGLHQELSTLLEESGHGTKTLPTEKLGNFVLPIPPIDEQKEIIEYIETQSKKIDQAIALQQQQIDKLKEYKTTLINSAVTGKIKVEA